MGQAIKVGGDKVGRKMVLGQRQYDVDGEGCIYPVAEDVDLFIAAGFKAFETKKKPVVANAKELSMEVSEEVEEEVVEEEVVEVKLDPSLQSETVEAPEETKDKKSDSKQKLSFTKSEKGNK